MGAIKKAFQSIGKGIEKAVSSVGQIAKGLVTLDLKAAAAGMKGLVNAGAGIMRGMINLTPAAMAANSLLDGALDKVLKKAEKAATSIAGKMIDSFEEGLSNIKNGVKNIAKGIASGNLKKALEGLKDVALGAMDTASNFGPGGIAKNLARMAVDTALDMATQKVAQTAAKTLDPQGNSVIGGMAADMIGAAASGAAGSVASRRLDRDTSGTNGPQAPGPQANAHTAPNRLDASPALTAPTTFRQSVRADARDATSQAADAAAQVAIEAVSDILVSRLTRLLDPNGDSAAVDNGASLLGDLFEDSANRALESRRNRGRDTTPPPQRADAARGNNAPANNAQANVVPASNATQAAPAVTPLRQTLRDAANQAILDALEGVMQYASQLAVLKAVDAMPLDQALALASLGKLLGGQGGGQAGAQAGVGQRLRDGLQATLEAALKRGIEGTQQAVGNSLQQPQGTGGPRAAVRDAIALGVRDAVGQVVAGVLDAAAKAADTSAARGKPQLVASATIEHTVQTAFEIRVRA